ncbi:molybdenum cofactor guanylyltransferase [Virgibacillus sp. DJP39]|uniref:molybdenum cofactor guanylyltransferase n=1 Tax=Virgibacillus sp. DJP39 TaxID=3409790 RepID=UPI003BB76D66
MIENKMINICVVILAGGHSSRMGMNKALLPIRNKPVIEKIVGELGSIGDRTIINSNQPSTYTYLGFPVIKDNYVDQGPLAGMEAAMSHVDANVFIISACDTPFVKKEVYLHLLDQLNGFDAVVPIYKGKIHPLSGIYTKNVNNKLQQQLDKQERKVSLMFDHLKVRYVDEFSGIPMEHLDNHFFNMNRPDEYEEAKRL